MMMLMSIIDMMMNIIINIIDILLLKGPSTI